MADTSINLVAERWIVAHGLSDHFAGQLFRPKKLKLSWGGFFAFDAVSEDEGVVVSITTSAARTASGNVATAKYQKLKTDALYLLHIAHKCRQVMVFTEACMREYFAAVATAGRFPPSIELMHVELPTDLQAKVVATRVLASKETSPTHTRNEA